MKKVLKHIIQIGAAINPMQPGLPLPWDRGGLPAVVLTKAGVRLFLIAALFVFGNTYSVFSQPLVDIGIFPVGSDTLEIRMMPKGTFNGVVSNVVFTLRWETGCGNSLGNIVQTGTQATYIPMQKSGAQINSGGYTYQVFGGIGLQTMSSVSASFSNNVAVSLMKIKVNNPKGVFEIVNDTWTNQINNNGNFFVSLNGQNKTGAIYQPKQTYVQLGAVSICQGESILLGGINRTTPGVYYDTLQGIGGCDSILRITLSVLPNVVTNISVSICPGGSYFAGGAQRTTSGIYYDTLTRSNGCDSIVATTLSLLPNALHHIYISICNGQSIIAGGDYRTTTGIYYDTLNGQNGCDSIVATHLTVHPNYFVNANTSICQGSTLFVGGAFQNTSGIYYDTLPSRFGCDSIIATNLTVELTVHFTRNVAVCNGNGIFAGGSFRTMAGTYYDTLTASFGCDSVVTTNLTIKPKFAVTVNVSICQGGNHFAGGQFRTTAGIYQDILIAANGCDSVVTTNLSVNPVFTFNRSVSICQGESFVAGGATRTTSGIYRDTLATQHGCDSIIVTQLIVYPTYLINRSAAICQGESISLGGAVRTTAGTYYDLLTSSYGCDSLIATVLTIKPHKFTAKNELVCNGDGVIAGGDFQTMPGTYYDTLNATNGCDSIIATTLAVRPEFATSVTVEICQGESHFAGGQFRAVAGIYLDMLTASNGCDSMVTTNLTVKPVFTFNRSMSICQGESFIAGGAPRTISGIFRDTLATQHGCDSIIVTQLTVNPIYLMNASAVICQGESILLDGALRTTAGTYYDTLVSTHGCDSVIATALAIKPHKFTGRNTSVCNGDGIIAGGAFQTTAGTYYDTLVAANGCDSVIATTLTVLPEFASSVTVEICQGESHFAGGQLRTTAGIYQDVLAASNGCDSVVTTTLIVHPVFTFNRVVNICQGESYFVAGANRTTSGIYRDTLATQHGCDSINVTQLFVRPKYFVNINASICEGNALFVGGAFQNTSGIYYDTLNSRFGCDSVIATSLAVEPIVHFTRNIAVCNGDGVVAGGAFQAIAGTYFDTLVAFFGCDSVVITNLTIKPEFAVTINASICQGENYFAGGQLRTVAGTYQDVLAASNGCDSVVTTNLTVNPVFTFNRSVSICQSENFFVAGTNRTVSGTYRDTLSTQSGCDSIIVTQLIVNPTHLTSRTVSICLGESFFVGGANQIIAGIYFDTLSTGLGCDSVIATTLAVKAHSFFTRDISVCNGDGIVAGGAFQTLTGNYFDTLIAANGCDSIVTTNLTVKPEFATTVNVEICNGESHFVGGALQTTTGIYQDIRIASNGCDSVVTTNLTVKPEFATSVSVEICNGENHLAGGALQTTTGIYQDVLIASNGCDSVVTTNLIVHPVFMFNQSVSICQGESFIAGSASQTVSGIYRDTLSTQHGCDSILVTQLTVYPTYLVNRAIEICSSESFFVGGANQTTVGTYYDSLSTVLGCDSVIETTLTVKAHSFFTRNVSVCNGEGVIAGGAFRTTAGTYFDTLVAANGCDSIVTTNLTVKPEFVTTVNVEICAGESHFAGGQLQTTTGEYIDALTANNGCDSVVTTNLLVHQNEFTLLSVSICQGDSFLVGTNYVYVQGSYLDTLSTVFDCDSIVQFNVFVVPAIIVNQLLTACAGDAVFAGGANQTTAGIYFDTFISSGGCDSIVVTELTFHPVVTSIIDVQVQQGGSYFVGGALQIESGVYFDTLVSAVGCDSILTTNLVVLNLQSHRLVNTIENTLTVRAIVEKGYVDNTYGAGAVGWDNTQTLDSLITSDHLRLALYDMQAEKKLDMVIDYFSQDQQSPTGFSSLGVSGGEGYVVEGSDTNIINATTSINENFNTLGYVLINTSPLTDTTYTPNLLYPDWIFEVWYEATVKLNAFESSQFGYSDILELHASPNKETIGEADTVLPADCPRATLTNIVMCEGDSYFVGGAYQTLPGTYYDTLLAVDSCDMIVVSILTVFPASRTNLTVNICEGDTYFADGAYQTQAGIYFDTLRALNKCDSIITTELIVYPSYNETLDVSICEGKSHFAGGALQLTSGIYIDSYTTAHGCDSVIVTNLSVLPVLSFNHIIISCVGDVVFVGGGNQTVPGVYFDSLVSFSGCDSIISTELIFNQHSTTDVFVEICSGETYFAEGANQSANGIYFDTLVSANGCDSVVSRHLTVLPVFATNLQVSICQGESYFIGGANRTTTGIYYDTLVAANGCDSVIATQLTVLSNALTNLDVNICQGESYFAGGASRIASGTYQDIFTAGNGCDSTVITELTVLPNVATANYVSICQGYSYFVGGTLQTTTGFYTDTFSAGNGCDSVVITNLLVQQAITTIIPVTVCSGESYFASGAWRTVSGNYRDTLVGENCDSIVIISLTVLPEFSGVRQIAICSSESIFAGGAYQNTPGDYYDTVIAENGCDSILITSLSIVAAYEQTVYPQICAGESYYAGGAFQTTSGIYTDVYVVESCDSLVITQLTVLPVSVDSITVEICSNETYFVQGANRNTAGVYTDVLTAVNGCDSTIVTTLIVTPAYSRSRTVFICAGETYFAGGALRSSPGIFRDTFITTAGCDSIWITDLRTRAQQVIALNVSSCEGDSIFAGGNFQTQAGIYYDTLLNRFGCDSILITNYSLDDTIHTNHTIEFCGGDSVFAGGAYQTQPGVYIDSFIATGGCDSLVFTTLIFSGETITNKSVTICAGDSVFAAGEYRITSGIYTDTIAMQNACDSILITEVIVLPVSVKTIYKKICDNTQYFAEGAWRNNSGLYYFDTLTAANGCDSLVMLNLEVKQVIRDTNRVAICQGEKYFAGGALRSTAGTYTDVYIAAGGCDSIVSTVLTIKPRFTRYKPVMLCNGESYFAGGQIQNRPGIYLDTFTARNGCDSIVLTILNIRQAITRTNMVSICDNETYFAGGALQDANGVYYDTFTANNGCDSVVTTILTVKPTFISDRFISICRGESIFLQGANRFDAGAYFDTLTARNGCDSIVITNLSVRNLRYSTRSISICSGENFFLGGTLQTSAGNYYDTLTAANGCDSIVTTQLTVLPVSATTHNVAICAGETYFASGALRSVTGNYFDTLIAANGCDSVVTTVLTILSHSASARLVEICLGENYFAGGANQTVAGNYYDTLVAANGCDSVVTTVLNILLPSVTNVAVSICENETFFLAGQLTSAAGVYYDTSIAANGCDSIVVTTLSLKPTFTGSRMVEICAGDSIYLESAFRTQAGIYSDTFTASNGCDSVVVTTLVAKIHSVNTRSVSICAGESFYVGGQFQMLGATYFDTLNAANGCDSILITKLTVLPVYHETLAVTICASETYYAGGNMQSASGIYFDTLTSVFGCDSIIETQLTVLPVFETIFGYTICGTERIFAAGDFQNTSGIYYDTLQSANGCDSVLVTALIVLDAYTEMSTLTICDGEGYFAQGALQTTSGLYYDTLIAVNGCDSVLVSDLIVLSVPLTTLNVSICEGENYFAQGIFQITSGTYYDTLWAANGCDSIVITNLNVIPVVSETVSVTICSNETYFAQAALQNASGIYYDTLESSLGCDSILITELTVIPASLSNLSVSICMNESYFAAGAWRNQAGVYADTFTTTYGCDSIIVTHLLVRSININSEFISICAGESYFVEGALQTQPGQYVDSFIAANGCDSILVTNLTVLNTFSSSQSITICDDESYFAGGSAQTASGIYFDTLTAFNGCDSIVTTQLIVLNSSFIVLQVDICAGESHFAAGAYQSQSGIYYDTLVAANGCDSIVETALTVLPSYQFAQSVSICSNDSIFLQGVWRNMPGIYVDVFSSIDGCDSIVTTQLSLLPVITTYDYPIVCTGTQIFLEGNFQTESGTYVDTFTSSFGCDSIVITQLTVLETPITHLTAAICDGESIFIAGAIRTQAGIYTDTLSSWSGCDSLVMTTLIVYSSPVADAGGNVAICAGESVMLQATGGIAYLWSNNMFTSSITVSPIATQSYSVIVENGFGCTAADTVTVTINPLPVLSISGLNTTYCAADADAQLTGSPLGGTFSGLGVSGNTFSPSVLAIGTYAITYSYTDANGCSASTSAQVIILQSPAASFTGLNSAYCFGSNTQQLTGNPTGGIFTGVGISGNTFNPTLAGTGTHAITYSVTPQGGCTALTTQFVTVNALPQVTFEIADTLLCLSETISLHALPSGGIYSGNGVTGSTFTAEEAGAGYHLLIYSYTDTNGCLAADFATVNVLANPFTQIDSISKSFCISFGEVQLNGAPAGGTFTGTSIIGNTFNTLVAGMGTHQYTYSITDTFGCTGVDTGHIIVYGEPNVQLSGLNAEYCENADPVVLSGAPLNGTFSGSGVVVNVFDPEIAGVGGPYPIVYRYSDNLGCVARDTQWVTVNALPELNLDHLDLTYCENGAPIDLSAFVTGNFSGPGISNNVFNPLQAGLGAHTAYYSYTDSNNCSANISATVLVELCSGISTPTSEEQILVYPNPFRESIHLDIESKGEKELQVTLYDVLGKAVFTKTIHVQHGMNTVTISQLEMLSSGIYYLETAVGKTKQLSKLMKY